MSRQLPVLIAALLGGAAAASVSVKSEQVNPAEPTWKFKTIPGPSKSDIAQHAKVTLSGNQWADGGGDGAVLVNGLLPESPNALAEEAFLANDNALGGNIVIDLGRPQPVAAVESYSWHEFPDDEGARGPQVYTLYGSAAETAKPDDLSTWTKIADVDTRPNKTGGKWNGQHGVSISDSTGRLGEFRYLMFAVQPTLSPKQPGKPWTNTLFA